jgi:hypothetical protein
MKIAALALALLVSAPAGAGQFVKTPCGGFTNHAGLDFHLARANLAAEGWIPALLPTDKRPDTATGRHLAQYGYTETVCRDQPAQCMAIFRHDEKAGLFLKVLTRECRGAGDGTPCQEVADMRDECGK